MDWRTSLLPFFQLFSAVAASTTALLAWRRRATPGGLPLTLLMLAVTAWSVSTALEMLAAFSEERRMLWESFETIGASSASALYLLFILEYTRQTRKINRQFLLILWLLPVYALLIALMQLFQLAPGLAITPPEGGKPANFIFWAYIGYHYLLQLGGAFALAHSLLRYPVSFRRQAITLFAGAALPWLAEILVFLHAPVRFSLFPLLDVQPIAYALGGLTLGWGILRYRLFDLVPIAREAVFEKIMDGLVVMDNQNRVVDLNANACYLLNLGKTVIGHLAEDVFQENTALLETLQRSDLPFNDLLLGAPVNRWVELMSVPLLDQRGEEHGKLLTLHDITSRVAAETALKESESNLTALFEVAPFPLTVTDPASGRVLFINPAGIEFYQIQPGELSTHTASDYYQNPADRTQILAVLRRAGKVDNYEVEMKSQNGDRHWVLMSARPLRYKNQEALLAVQIDISQRKQTEDELRRSRAQLKVIFDHAGVGIRVLDANGIYTFINQRWAEMLGRLPEEIIGKPEIEFLHKEDIPYNRHLFETLIQGEIDRYQVESRYQRCDGSFFLGAVSSAPIYAENGHLEAVVGFISDITQRKQTEISLRETERRFREVLENVSLFAILLDKQGNLTFANDHLLRTLQLHSKDLLGRNWFELFVVTNIEEREEFARAIQNGAIISRHESAILLPNGQQRLVSWSNILLRDEANAISGMASIGEDITERRRAQEVEREQRQYAQMLNNTLAALTSTLDINEALDLILSNLNKVIQIDAANISLIQRGVAQIVRSSGYQKHGIPDETINQIKLPVKKIANLAAMIASRQPLLIPDVQRYPTWAKVPETAWIRSYMGAPILVDEKVIGFISVDSAIPNYFQESHLRHLRDFSLQAAIAIKNARLFERSRQTQKNLGRANRSLKIELAANEKLRAQLREQTIRDPLTGLYNRRFLEETLQRELSRAQREGQPVGVVMMDIDLFKSVNDSYSHAAGDLMLKKLGEMLLNDTRQGDVACRYGGEEFAIILPGASLEAALQRAEKWRQKFIEIEITYGPFSISATLSMGVACYPQHGVSGASLISAADQGLYEAKHTGRNRVCAAAAYT